MSVHLCDRCGDVTVDSERCHCATAAATAGTRRAPAVAPSTRAAPSHATRLPGPPARRRTLAIQLLTPLPRVTVARLSGTLEESTSALLTEKITALFGKAVHVVVDLAGTDALTRGGVRVLLSLSREATGRGTQLHLTRPAPSAGGTGRRLLDRLAADRLIRLAPSVDAVVAELSATPRTRSATSSG
ncbi:MAG: STAS domain-containing protein [Pseudonocardia sp.]|nr:STAS domain-containing protein [Pseudonocardia sp.]